MINLYLVSFRRVHRGSINMTTISLLSIVTAVVILILGSSYPGNINHHSFIFCCISTLMYLVSILCSCGPRTRDSNPRAGWLQHWESSWLANNFPNLYASNRDWDCKEEMLPSLRRRGGLLPWPLCLLWTALRARLMLEKSILLRKVTINIFYIIYRLNWTCYVYHQNISISWTFGEYSSYASNR